MTDLPYIARFRQPARGMTAPRLLPRGRHGAIRIRKPGADLLEPLHKVLEPLHVSLRSPQQEVQPEPVERLSIGLYR
jgi:hypothetical protein